MQRQQPTGGETAAQAECSSTGAGSSTGGETAAQAECSTDAGSQQVQRQQPAGGETAANRMQRQQPTGAETAANRCRGSSQQLQSVQRTQVTDRLEHIGVLTPHSLQQRVIHCLHAP